MAAACVPYPVLFSRPRLPRQVPGHHEESASPGLEGSMLSRSGQRRYHPDHRPTTACRKHQMAAHPAPHLAAELRHLAATTPRRRRHTMEAGLLIIRHAASISDAAPPPRMCETGRRRVPSTVRACFRAWHLCQAGGRSRLGPSGSIKTCDGFHASGSPTAILFPKGGSGGTKAKQRDISFLDRSSASSATRAGCPATGLASRPAGGGTRTARGIAGSGPRSA
jgi:hypothetical protein